MRYLHPYHTYSMCALLLVPVPSPAANIYTGGPDSVAQYYDYRGVPTALHFYLSDKLATPAASRDSRGKRF